MNWILRISLLGKILQLVPAGQGFGFELKRKEPNI